MPTVWTEDNDHGFNFDSVVVKRNGYVVGIEARNDKSVKSHYPPRRIKELEGDVQYE